MVSDYGLTVSQYVEKHGVLPVYEFVSRYLWCPVCKDTLTATRLEHGGVETRMTKRAVDEELSAVLKRHDGRLVCPVCHTELTGDEHPEPPARPAKSDSDTRSNRRMDALEKYSRYDEDGDRIDDCWLNGEPDTRQWGKNKQKDSLADEWGIRYFAMSQKQIDWVYCPYCHKKLLIAPFMDATRECYTGVVYGYTIHCYNCDIEEPINPYELRQRMTKNKTRVTLTRIENKFHRRNKEGTPYDRAVANKTI